MRTQSGAASFQQNQINSILTMAEVLIFEYHRNLLIRAEESHSTVLICI